MVSRADNYMLQFRILARRGDYVALNLASLYIREFIVRGAKWPLRSQLAEISELDGKLATEAEVSPLFINALRRFLAANSPSTAATQGA
jgi:hypothetical protein